MYIFVYRWLLECGHHGRRVDERPYFVDSQPPTEAMTTSEAASNFAQPASSHLHCNDVETTTVLRPSSDFRHKDNMLPAVFTGSEEILSAKVCFKLF